MKGMESKLTAEYKGLSNDEAADRLAKFGENILGGKKGLRPLVALLEKFNSPLLIILTIAALVSFFLGERTNSIIILGMVIVSGMLDFVNSYKSEKAVEKLIARVTNTATVFRDGAKTEVLFPQIVPGDVVFLSAGDIVPADAEVLEAKDFFLNEAVLTGESYPVEKSAAKKEGGFGSPFENPNLVFMGTSVVTGYAVVKVLTTGPRTEFGKIAERLVKAVPETDFEKGIKSFSFFIMRVTFGLVLFVFLANAFFGKGLFESFLFAVAIAVGLTPELLPVIMVISLSRGSAHMAKKEVIVKNLSAIESLGDMDILCTDKTGTLTENRITLVKHVDGFGRDSESVLLHSYLGSIFHTGIRSPLDDAIRVYKHLSISEYEKVDEAPFDFERKRDSVFVKKGGKTLVVTKGAPEDVMKISDSYLKDGVQEKLDNATMKTFVGEYDRLSREGFRVLAVAFRELPAEDRVYDKEDERNMVFLGFTAFMDPAKKTAIEAIDDLKRLGVEIKILTGDSELLTEKICRDIGLDIKGMVLGGEIMHMSDEELGRLAERTTIFARVNPEEKERIVIALNKIGRSVGYLGDGINDTPALRAADVGISVNNAVDVAKETADIILLRKSLRVLHDGIVEGRRVFSNTMKYISMGLSSNFGNMASMTAASVFLPFLPMMPTQILLNNFLYDTSQWTLTTDSVDDEEIVKPAKWNMAFVKKYMVVFGLLSSVFDFITFGTLYLVFRLSESGFQTGWFIESLATQVFVIYIIRTKKVPFLQSSPSLPLFLNTFLVVAFAWVLPLIGIGKIFSFASLPPLIYLGIAVIVLVYLFCAEILKRIFYSRLVRAAQ
jgi:P-type Mg2+ transporter